MKKVLMLPSYLGGGFGHIGRCLALAEELRKRGWEASFAMGDPHMGRVREAGFPIFQLHKPYEPKAGSKEGPAFTVFSEFSYQLVRDGLTSPGAVRDALAEQLKVVRQFEPDLLVSDAWPLAKMLAHLVGLPLVQIVRGATHPVSPRLMWWQEPPAALQPPDPRPVFNPLLRALGMQPIVRAEDLLTGDLYLVPAFPEMEPIEGDLENTHFIGPLIRARQSAAALPEWLDWGSELLVYITLGGGAGPVGGPEFYRKLFCALDGIPARVVASTGKRFSPSLLQQPPQNFRVEEWLPGPAVISRSDLVIYPGGYGTTMELVQAGVPGVVIPFHTEQESNARRLEAAGAAEVLLPSDEEPMTVAKRWRGGRFTYQVYPFSSLSSSALRSAVMKVLETPSYRENAARLQSLSSQYAGPAQAADLVESLALPEGQPSKGLDSLSLRQRLALSPFVPVG
jgi:MGT family glycosyltransferase